jgi:hypothetical protein
MFESSFHDLPGGHFLDLEDLHSILQCIHPGYCAGVCVVKKLIVVSFVLQLCRNVPSTWLSSIPIVPVWEGVQVGRAPTTK